MNYILPLLLLWKCVPVLLNFFDIQRDWQDVDVNDKPIIFGSGVPVMGSHRKFVSKSEAWAAAAASAYAVYNIFNGGR